MDSRNSGQPIAPVPGGVRLRVRVQPRASRTEVVGRHGDAIRIRLNAPPVDGAANDALVRFLADLLGVARAAITLEHGHTGRLKVLRVEGADAALAARRLLPDDS